MVDKKCEFCEYIGRKDNMKRHVERVHENPTKIENKNVPKYVCGCGQTFTAASSLKRHREGKCSKEIDASSEPFELNDIVKVEIKITLRDGSTRTVPAAMDILSTNTNIQMINHEGRSTKI